MHAADVPAQPGRMPAEWAPHERCLMAWPVAQRAELWGPLYEDALAEFAGVARAIARFEPVLMVAAPGAGAQARAACGAGVEVLELPIDDSWMRDAGPIFCLEPGGGRHGVTFRFNSWGEKFLPYDQDALLAGRLLEELGERRVASEMVLEGGAITVDGEGTLITTEQCLLNPNRNPSMDRSQIEAELCGRLGVERVIWLPYGQFDDPHTDGHVDGVCAFTAPGRVILQTCSIPGHPDVERSAANRAVLDTATDAPGRPLEIVELPYLPFVEVGGEELAVSYLNFYIANGGVIVPIAGHPDDAPALELLAAVFPDREIVGVPGPVISYGGGGVHCITQQVPR